MKGWTAILGLLLFSSLSFAESRLGSFCRLLEQDRLYLEENLETVLRGELTDDEMLRLAPLPSSEKCEENFAFEVDKAEFLLVGLKSSALPDLDVSRTEISFGTPTVNQMQKESASGNADSLILLEMVGSLPSALPEKVVEMKFSGDASNAALRKDFPVLWQDLVASLRSRIKNASRSFKLSETSPRP